MARQYFIPGYGGLSETSRRQYFVPGLMGMNESGAASYSASFAETLTTADAESASMTASTALAEASTVADSYLPLPRYFSAFTPGGYAINEGVARQFFVPGQGGINLTGRAKVLAPVSVAFSYPTSESTASADSQASSAAFGANTADFAFVSDLPAAQPVYSSRYGKAQYGRARYGAGKLPPAPPPSGGASAVYGRASYGRTRYASKGGISYNATFTAPYVMVRYGDQVAEAVTMADILSALAAYGDQLNETTGGSDAANLSNSSYLFEQSATGDLMATNAVQSIGFGESSMVNEDQAAVSAFMVQLAEMVVTGDAYRGVMDLPTPLYRIIKAEG